MCERVTLHSRTAFDDDRVLTGHDGIGSEHDCCAIDHDIDHVVDENLAVGLSYGHHRTLDRTKARHVYFSGDAGNITTDLSWSAWNTTSAVAHGTWHYLNCRPNCASGTSTPYPVTITLTNPTGGHFTKLVEQTAGPHAFTQTLNTPQLGQGACTTHNNSTCAFA